MVPAQTIRGVVLDDSTRMPVEGATVTLLNLRGTPASRPPSRSDSAGRFSVYAAEAGRYRLRVVRIGYQPLTSGEIELGSAAVVVDVSLRIAAHATKLGTVVVTATSRLSRDELMSHVGYELRRAKGNGKFIDSIELHDLMRHTIGYHFEDARLRFGIELSATHNLKVKVM
jgi:hypothetical protein